jgi:hypothetical protein
MAQDTIYGFPSPLKPDKDKNSQEYGLKVMRTAYYQWVNGYGGFSQKQRQTRFDYNKAYATGTQPMQEFLDYLDINGQQPYSNLDFTPLPVAISIIQRIKDRFNQRIEKIRCNAIDPVSVNRKAKEKANAEFRMKYKGDIEQIQQETGLQLEDPKSFTPEDNDELDVFFGFTYKEREEVMMEQGIDLVLYQNDWTETKDAILDDLITFGFSGTKSFIDNNGKIRIRKVNPYNLLLSYSERPDMKDLEWTGEVVYMPITEVRQQFPGKVSEEELFNLAKNNVGKFNNPASFTFTWNFQYANALSRPYDSFRVPVLQMSYRTLYNITYEKNQDRFGKTILDRTEKMKDGKEYVKSKPFYVVYDGAWICDTNHLLHWAVSENMARPNDNLQDCLSPYTIYMYNNNRMTNKPLIETMIPSIKQMQLAYLKIQSIIANAAPDGYSVDIAGMADVDLGNGKGALQPLELIRIYKQTGIIFHKGRVDEMEGSSGLPINPLNVPFTAKLESFINLYNFYLNNLERMIGSNALDQGMISNQAVGAKVLESARQIGESSINYIYNSYLNILERSAKLTQMRLWDILVFGKKGYEGYKYALGTDRVEYIKLEATDEFEKINFDVKIEAVIDSNEKMMLEQNIQQALAQQSIELEDAIQIRLLDNPKAANYYLVSAQKKRRKLRMEEAQQNSQMQMQQAVQAAQAKSQGELQLEQAKAQFKLQQYEEELESDKERETLKYFNILRVKTLEKLLEQGVPIEEMPSFIFDGIDGVVQTQKQIIMEELSDMQEQAMAEQQQQMEMAQQQAMEAQQQQQGGQEMQQDGQEMVQEAGEEGAIQEEEQPM